MTYGGTTPAGWYPDPYVPGASRYWDGSAWTTHVQAAYGAFGVAPPFDRNDGRKAADRAQKAFMAQAIVQVLAALLYAAWATSFADYLRQVNRTPNEKVPLPGSLVTLNLLLQPIGIVGLVCTVMIVMWCHRATTNARALGWTTTHSPGWAVGGWFVPIINFWYPEQTVRDLLPVDHPLRRRVALWWGLHLAASFTLFIPAVIAGLNGVAAGAVAALVPIGFVLGALSVIHEIVPAVRDAQDDAAASLGGPVSPG